MERITVETHRPSRQRLAGVYGLVDPNEPERVRYVGSSQHLVKRLYDHASGYVPRALDGPKRAWLAELKRAGRRPEMVVLQRLASGKATPETHAAEREWIRKLNAIGQADLNAVLRSERYEVLLLREQVKNCMQEIARLEAELAATRNDCATLHQKLRCAAPQPATQRNGGIEPVARVAGERGSSGVNLQDFA